MDFDSALGLLHQHATDPDAACEAVTFLAGASRSNPQDRERLAEPATLEDLLTLLDTSLTDPSGLSTILTPTLRCIGNAVIASDAARQIITDRGFDWARTLLDPSQLDAALKLLAFRALYNICHDFAPAQKRCCAEGVHEELLRCVLDLKPSGNGEAVMQDFGQWAELLLSICDQREQGAGLKDETSRERVLDFALVLRATPYEGKAEDLATAGEIALTYLREEGEQGKFVEQRLIKKVWRLLEEVQTCITDAKDDSEALELLLPLSTSLTWCLSDIAAKPEFAEAYGKRSDLIHADVFDAIKDCVQRDGSNGPRPVLLNAACQVLGNLLWSVKDKDTTVYDVDVMDSDLHQGLMRVAVSAKDAETLHSVAGLLIQMIRYSAEYEVRLRKDDQLAPVMKTLCENDSKEVRQGGLKLLQLLGKSDPTIREQYADLAKQVLESLVAEQSSDGETSLQQNGTVVEVPD